MNKTSEMNEKFLKEVNDVLVLEMMSIVGFDLTEDVFENQYNVLLEEMEELSLANDNVEFVDAVGDVYFVLKTLMLFKGTDIGTEEQWEMIKKIEDEFNNIPLTGLEKEKILEKVNESNFSKFPKERNKAEEAIKKNYDLFDLDLVIKEINGYFVIVSNKNQNFNGKNIKKGKFLKGIDFFEPKFDELGFVKSLKVELPYKLKHKELSNLGVHDEKK